jgi:DNA-binding PadR family transcriptional regulator
METTFRLSRELIQKYMPKISIQLLLYLRKVTLDSQGYCTKKSILKNLRKSKSHVSNELSYMKKDNLIITENLKHVENSKCRKIYYLSKKGLLLANKIFISIFQLYKAEYETEFHSRRGFHDEILDDPLEDYQ